MDQVDQEVIQVVFASQVVVNEHELASFLREVAPLMEQAQKLSKSGSNDRHFRFCYFGLFGFIHGVYLVRHFEPYSNH